MDRLNWGRLLLGIAAGAAIGYVIAKTAPRYGRKVRAGVSRVQEARDVVREALEVFEDFRSLARPLEEAP